MSFEFKHGHTKWKRDSWAIPTPILQQFHSLVLCKKNYKKVSFRFFVTIVTKIRSFEFKNGHTKQKKDNWAIPTAIL